MPPPEKENHTPKWFVVADDLSYEEADPEAEIWTISRDPERLGWKNDCNQNGYGLLKKDAEELLTAANAYTTHKEVIRELVNMQKRALDCWNASHNSTELWEAWADNLGEKFKDSISKAEKLL